MVKKAGHDSKTGKFTPVRRDERAKGERWVISKNGETHTYTTSAKSTRVIEGAAKKYSKALKRLADR